MITKPVWYQSSFTEHMDDIVQSVKSFYEVDQPPFRLESLVANMGVHLNFAPISGEGMVYKKDGQHIITINPSNHRYRNRFTIAHEVAHIILNDYLIPQAPHQNAKSVELVKEKESEERFADQFASYLLFPSHELGEQISWSDFSIQKVIGKARELNVSISVVLRRLLEYLGGGYIWLNKMNKPTDLNEFRWRLVTGGFPQLDLGSEKYFLPQYDSIEVDSPILSALDTDKEIFIDHVKLDFGSFRSHYSVFAKAIKFSPSSISSWIRKRKKKEIVFQGDTTILMIVLPKEIHVSNKNQTDSRVLFS